MHVVLTPEGNWSMEADRHEACNSSSGIESHSHCLSSEESVLLHLLTVFFYYAIWLVGGPLHRPADCRSLTRSRHDHLQKINATCTTCAVPRQTALRSNACYSRYAGHSGPTPAMSKMSFVWRGGNKTVSEADRDEARSPAS